MWPVYIQRLDGVLYQVCRGFGCHAHVRETLKQRFDPSYLETVLCPECGADNSTRPPLSWRLRYGLKLAAKRRKVYGGWMAWLAKRPWECWQMPYERADAPHKVAARQVEP